MISVSPSVIQASGSLRSSAYSFILPSRLSWKFSTKLMVMKYGVDPDIAGIFSSIAPFGTILLTPLFGLIYDRYGRGVTLVITGALMLTAVHFGFSMPMHSSTIAIMLMVTLSVGYSLAPAALWPCVPKIIPLKCLGTAYSMIFFIQNFGRAIIPMLVGVPMRPTPPIPPRCSSSDLRHSGQP